VLSVTPEAGDGGLTVVDVVPSGADQDDAALDLVRALREDRPSKDALVTGSAAFLVDLNASLAERLPWALLLIAVATFVLLFLMTGSVLVPAKALVMNVLSLGASFGALVLVFQEGWLAGPLGVEPAAGLQTWVPVLVFVFAFGLSMDYEVFLLSRIKELVDEGYDNDTAVALGLQRSGRIITCAALLLLIVFAAGVGFMPGIFPTGGIQTPNADLSGFAGAIDVLNHLILPGLTLTLAYLGEYALIMRSSLLDVMGEDYVTTARAKGLREALVLRKHVVPNALLPTVTLTALNLGFVVSGAITVETVFPFARVNIRASKRGERLAPLANCSLVTFSRSVFPTHLSTSSGGISTDSSFAAIRITSALTSATSSSITTCRNVPTGPSSA